MRLSQSILSAWLRLLREQVICSSWVAYMGTSINISLFSFSPGGLCGGVFIDEAFERICKRRLDPHWKGLSRAAKTDFMKGPWENSIKHHFKPGNAQAEYPLSLPNEMLFSAKGKGKQKRLLNDTTKEPHIVDGHIHFKELVTHTTGSIPIDYLLINPLTNISLIIGRIFERLSRMFSSIFGSSSKHKSKRQRLRELQSRY